MLLLKLDIILNKLINKIVNELKFNISNNTGKEYKIKIIENCAVYIKKLKSNQYLFKFYNLNL